jgi:hypothetical protein
VKESPQQTPLSREQRIAILEAIARDSEAYPRDRIAAIKALEEMRQAEQPSDGFEDLDEVAQRRVRSRKPA